MFFSLNYYSTCSFRLLSPRWFTTWMFNLTYTIQRQVGKVSCLPKQKTKNSKLSRIKLNFCFFTRLYYVYYFVISACHFKHGLSKTQTKCDLCFLEYLMKIQLCMYKTEPVTASSIVIVLVKVWVSILLTVKIFKNKNKKTYTCTDRTISE